MFSNPCLLAMLVVNFFYQKVCFSVFQNWRQIDVLRVFRQFINCSNKKMVTEDEDEDDSEIEDE